MTRAEIKFLRSAGFSIAEIMAMNPQQNDDNSLSDHAGSMPPDSQNAQNAEPAPAQAPAAPAQAPAAPAQAPAASAQSAGDPQTAMLDKLDKILAAVQAGNRSGASVQTPEKKTPEEIAGQLY